VLPVKDLALDIGKESQGWCYIEADS